MKKHLPLAFVAGCLVLGGCTSTGAVRSILGIRPALQEYGTFEGSKREVFEATRDALADMGYTFKQIDRVEGTMETRWYAYGNDWSHENHRYRVYVELTEDGNDGTAVKMVADHESNTSTDLIRPAEADWAQEDPDERVTDEVAYRIRKKLGGLENGDIFEKTKRRLDEEDARHPKKKMDYNEGK